MHMYMYTHIRMCVYICIYVLCIYVAYICNMYMCTHTHIYIYMYTYTHIHPPIYPPAVSGYLQIPEHILLNPSA